jgi:hypothetical protein
MSFVILILPKLQNLPTLKFLTNEPESILYRLLLQSYNLRFLASLNAYIWQVNSLFCFSTALPKKSFNLPEFQLGIRLNSPIVPSKGRQAFTSTLSGGCLPLAIFDPKLSSEADRAAILMSSRSLLQRRFSRSGTTITPSLTLSPEAGSTSSLRVKKFAKAASHGCPRGAASFPPETSTEPS